MAAALSVLKQERAPSFELIIVDNDPDGSALKAARRLARRADVRVEVLLERRIGLAEARNAGVRAARGKFVAFVDDNQIVSPRWLSQMLRVQRETQAEIVFGAIHARLNETAGRHSQFYESFFARDPDHAEGVIEDVYDCRCSLIHRRILRGDRPFSFNSLEEPDAVDPVLVEATAQGSKIAWAASAWVWQTPMREQLSIGYSLRSAYNLSRERTKQAIALGSRRARTVALNLVSGLGQTLAIAPVAAVVFCARSKHRAFVYRRLADGLGRLLWLQMFRLRGPDVELMPVAR